MFRGRGFGTGAGCLSSCSRISKSTYTSPLQGLHWLSKEPTKEAMPTFLSTCILRFSQACHGVYVGLCLFCSLSSGCCADMSSTEGWEVFFLLLAFFFLREMSRTWERWISRPRFREHLSKSHSPHPSSTPNLGLSRQKLSTEPCTLCEVCPTHCRSATHPRYRLCTSGLQTRLQALPTQAALLGSPQNCLRATHPCFSSPTSC